MFNVWGDGPERSEDNPACGSYCPEVDNTGTAYVELLGGEPAEYIRSRSTEFGGRFG